MTQGPRRLGGDAGAAVALGPREAAAAAADRRMRDNCWCPSERIGEALRAARGGRAAAVAGTRRVKAAAVAAASTKAATIAAVTPGPPGITGAFEGLRREGVNSTSASAPCGTGDPRQKADAVAGEDDMEEELMIVRIIEAESDVVVVGSSSGVTTGDDDATWRSKKRAMVARDQQAPLSPGQALAARAGLLPINAAGGLLSRPPLATSSAASGMNEEGPAVGRAQTKPAGPVAGRPQGQVEAATARQPSAVVDLTASDDEDTKTRDREVPSSKGGRQTTALERAGPSAWACGACTMVNGPWEKSCMICSCPRP